MKISFLYQLQPIYLLSPLLAIRIPNSYSPLLISSVGKILLAKILRTPGKRKGEDEEFEEIKYSWGFLIHLLILLSANKVIKSGSTGMKRQGASVQKLHDL